MGVRQIVALATVVSVFSSEAMRPFLTRRPAAWLLQVYTALAFKSLCQYLLLELLFARSYSLPHLLGNGIYVSWQQRG